MTATQTQTGTAVALVSPPSTGGALAPLGVFSSIGAFESAQRMAKALSTSNLVPEAYRGDGGMGNALIALDLGDRVGASPLMVMQNLDIIQGRPSWRSQFIISALNTCGRFSPLRWDVKREGDVEVSYEYWDGPRGSATRKTGKMTVPNITWVCWTIDKASGERLDGPEVTTVMAVQQGWWTKKDSKWPSMTDLMGRYRSAAFLGRLYAPEILMGMHTDDEVRDMVDVTPAAPAVPEPVTGATGAGVSEDTVRHVIGQVITDPPASDKPAGRGRGGGKKAAAPAGDAGGQQMQQAQQDHQPQGDTGGAQPSMPFDMRADDAVDASASDAPASTAAPKLDAPAGAGDADDYGFPE